MVKKFPNIEGLLCSVLSSFGYVLMFKDTCRTSMDVFLFIFGFMALFFLCFFAVSYAACQEGDVSGV